MSRPLRILVLSWNYPTPAAPQRGLWVQRMCEAAAVACQVTVVVPTPWVPPGIPFEPLARFRRVPAQSSSRGVDVFFPRVPGSIEFLTQQFDADLAHGSLRRCVARLHAERRFDLIHAHFIYPDGVIASRLGRMLGIPVMTTEHAFWTPWLTVQQRVGRQVAEALPHISLVTAVSDFLKRGIDEFGRGSFATAILPNVLDDEVFYPIDLPRDPDTLLFVGLVRRTKRLDVLIEALALARRRRPNLRLRVLSADAFRAYGRDRREIDDLIRRLGLGAAVDLVRGATPSEVADAMRRAALVAVSSARRETFCSVAAEALGCGTPLVITRCGGPEEFVGPEDGVMVAADDARAFAEGIETALSRRAAFDPSQMSRRITQRFGRDAWRARVLELYDRVAAEGFHQGNRP